MTKEQALKWIEEKDKFAKENNLDLPPMLEFVKDISQHYGKSLEEMVSIIDEHLKVGIVGETRPIRSKSCKNCKYFQEIPQKLSVMDLFEEPKYFRFCIRNVLHEPIDDTWELEHEVCFEKRSDNEKQGN